MIVTFRAEFDPTTNIMSQYIERALVELGVKPEAVIDLRSNRATRNHLIPVLQYYRPKVLIAEGHGYDNVFTGQNFDKVFWVGDEAIALLSGSRVYLMSCRTGKDLGPYITTRGQAELFVGYYKPFLLVHFPNRDFDEEPNRWFYEPQKYIIKAILDGKDAKDVFREGVRGYMKSIREARQSFSLWTPVSISALVNDLTVLITINRDGRYYRYREPPIPKRAVSKDLVTLLLGTALALTSSALSTA